MLRCFLICVLLSAIPTQSRVHRTTGEIGFADYGPENYFRNTDFHYPYRKLNVQSQNGTWQTWQEQDLKRDNTNDDEDSYMVNDDAKSTELKNEDASSRRLFSWFTKWFKTTTPKVHESIATTTESTYESDLKNRIFLKELHRNLTDALSKLSDIEKRVSEVMQLRESYTIITRGKPRILDQKISYYGVRNKRDINVNGQQTQGNNSADSNNVTNSTDGNNLTSTDCPCGNINNTSGRRFDSTFSPSEIKRKLLTYLDESFLDIKNKIRSLKSLKNTFSGDYSFRIGYILANIDTLETNLSNMKSNTDRNKDFWEDKKILELYDTLKVSNQAVAGLIESLKIYVGQLATSKTHSNIANNLDFLPYMRPTDIKG